MNNVQSIFGNNKPIFDGYGPADFDIETAPLKYLSKETHKILTSTKRIIYRTDTGAELGVHGKRYVAVPPKRLIDTSRSIILNSDLNTSGLKETIQTSHNGSRTFVKYDLPEHSYVTPDGDTATLSLLSITSFDGTWAFMMSCAATQYACTNLQVFTTGEIAVYKSKHTQGLDIARGSKIIMNSLNVMQNENELWHKYYNTSIRDVDAFNIFVKASKAEKTINKLKEFYGSNLSIEELLSLSPRENKALTYMYNIYKDTYKKRLGDNLWAVYNTMTDWSTHAEVSKRSENNIASVQHQRQQTVKDVVNSELLSLVA